MSWKTMTGVLALAVPLGAYSSASMPVPPALSGGEDPGQVFNKLSDEFNEAYGEYYTKLGELTESGAGAAELAAFEESWNPIGYYADLFQTEADAHAGDAAAYDFLQWIVRNPAGSASDPLPDAVTGALDTILAHHMEEPAFLSFVGGLHYMTFRHGSVRTLAMIDQVLAKAEGPLANSVKLSRTRVVLDDAESNEASCKEARAVLARLAKDELLGEQARSYLFELDNLQIGMLAPDIEAADLEGVNFKLSDYRGKVVMLDFWGDW